MKDNRVKRWLRGLRKKEPQGKMKMGDAIRTDDGGRVRLVYRPKTEEEARRRADRAAGAHGPFIHLPGNPPEDQVMLYASGGQGVTAGMVEMVYNDALLMDAISDHGKDGPLYEATIEGIQLEVYKWAQGAYRKSPCQPSANT